MDMHRLYPANPILPPRVIRTPFPTHRLASSALKALQVDAELSPLVRRSFSLVSPSNHSPSSSTSNPATTATTNGTSNHSSTPLSSTGSTNGDPGAGINRDSTDNGSSSKTVLVTEYKAKTNRMLRVAVNGFMESLGVVLGVMERLDVDVLPSAATVGPAPPTATAPVAAGN
ncbi:MAG: hypothetical protein LQ340_002655 [Diploschistes diacapsis]|nr:MAG: hypothetical protein LQ340_002655 [Diploschistes diacapsis]